MKYEMPFRVRVYECDPRGRLSLPSLLNYMQEIAAAHTVELHITVPELLPRGLTWMVTRHHIVIDRYPAYMDELRMSTWVAEHRGRFSIRDFTLGDGSPEPAVRISSSWVLYDLKRKRPVDDIAEALPLDIIVPERAVRDDFPSLPLVEDPAYERTLQVRRADLDINRHVNNRVFAEWTLESVPPAVAEDHDVSGLEIAFKGQAFYGENILSGCKPVHEKEQDPVLRHIIRNDKGRLIAKAATQWRKSPDKPLKFV